MADPTEDFGSYDLTPVFNSDKNCLLVLSDYVDLTRFHPAVLVKPGLFQSNGVLYDLAIKGMPLESLVPPGLDRILSLSVSNPSSQLEQYLSPVKMGDRFLLYGLDEVPVLLRLDSGQLTPVPYYYGSLNNLTDAGEEAERLLLLIKTKIGNLLV